jgi:hypothetical protein
MDTIVLFEKPLQVYLNSKLWVLKAGIFILFISAFFSLCLNSTQFVDRLNGFKLMSVHNYSQKQVISLNHYNVYWQFIKEQAENPFKQRHNYNVYMDHETNMIYRLCIPMIMRFTNLDLNGMLLLQISLGFLQLLATLQLAFKIFKDKLIAFYFSFCISTILFGQAYMLDYRGYGDSWAFAFMTFAIFFRHPLLVFLLVQMLFWVDERAIINTSFIAIWWIISNKKNEEKTTLEGVFKNAQLNAILFSGLVYLAIRCFIESKYHLDFPNKWQVPTNGSLSSIGPSLFKGALGSFGGIVFGAFEGNILYLIVGLYLIFLKKETVITIMVFLSCLISLISSLMIYDTSRSMAFSGILFFIFAIYFNEKFTKHELKPLLLIISFFNLLPVFFY